MSFEIRVKRDGKKGTLSFSNGGVGVTTPCWWDPAVVVDPGTYTGYATRMANKKDGWDKGNRQAIWLGKMVPVNNGSRNASGIFIHKGTSPAWSDGCIVIQEAELRKIWTVIEPKEKPNVTVIVEEA